MAGSTGGLISATGMDSRGGRIWLVSEGGTTTVSGTLEAQGLNGAPGQIETSGQTLNIGAAKVNAHGGTWLLDPNDLTIDATAAGTIDTSLSAGTNVTEQTTATTANGTGNQTAGAGDIIIAAPMSWTGTGILTLDAYHSVTVNQNVAVNGGGGVVIATNDGGTGGDLTFAQGASLSFASGQTGQALTIDGQAYTLEYSVGGLISAMNGNSSGFYALAQSGSPSGSYTAAAVGAFSGTLEGLGHSISGLTINAPNTNYVGLIGTLNNGGLVRDLNLVGGSITGARYAGGLVGQSYGTISNVTTSAVVTGTYNVGGLVGENRNYGTISNATATGAVSGNNDRVGGLVGYNSGGSTISNATATGAVNGGNYVGGLVGRNGGAITTALATGAVTASGNEVGGLVGQNTAGTINSATATGTVSGGYFVGGLVGRTFYGTVNNVLATGAVTGVRDVGGLVGLNQGAITNAMATGAVSGSGYDVGGLVGTNSSFFGAVGTVTNATATGAVSGASYVGGLVGYNTSTISNALATGAVSGASYVGGLVGRNYRNGTVSNSFWDNQTSGQSTSSGGTGYTTAQLQSGSANGGLGGGFAGGAGGLYPYLTALFPNGVQAISGTLYSGPAQTGLAATTVSLVGGGTALGSASSGANGYYYVALSAGTVTSGETLLAYSASPGASGATATGATAQAGVNLYSGVDTVPTTAVTLSTAPTLAQAQTTLLAQDGGIAAADTAINGATGLGLAASGAGFTVDQAVTGATTLIVQTTAANADITVAQPVTLSGAGGLGLFATGSVTVNAPIAVNGGGQVGLAYDTTANIYGGLQFGAGDSLTFASGQTGQALTINGQVYMLEYTVQNLISDMNANNAGAYALAQSGTPSGSYTAAAVATFSGTLEGLGNSISGLTITGSSNYAGLIGTLSRGLVRDINLIGGSVSGGNYVGGLVGYSRYGGKISNATATGPVTGSGYDVGGLVGINRGDAISNVTATGAVTGGGSNVGGLVGYNNGTISNATATGAVTGRGNVGGLIGYNYGGTISNAMATGAVTGGGSNVGGLVGDNYFGTISNALATGAVSGGGGNTGGLVGYNDNGGTVSNSFWDTQTSGQSTSAGGGTGLTTYQLQNGSANGGLGAAFAGGADGLYPYLTALFPNGVQAITATAAAGSQVGIYAGGVELGSGSVSTGADGYVYLAVPTGTFNASGNKVGADVALSGVSAPSGALYTDAGTVTNAILALGTVSSAINAQTTAETTYSGLQTDLGATFGPTTLAALNTALATTPVNITATGASFTVDQAVNAGGAFTLETPNGGLTLASTLTAGRAILLAANGSFTNSAGASALTPGGGAGFTVYSQIAGNVAGALPTDTLDGLTGVNWYNDAFSFTGGTFATAVPDGNYFVYGYAASLTPTLSGSAEKTYDRTTTAPTANITAQATLLNANGIADGTTLSIGGTAAYADANAGTGKTVTATSIGFSANPNNYTLASTTASAAVGIIDPKALTASLTGTVEKTYDGTTSATLAMNNYGLSGVVSGDSVSLNDPTSGTYDTANAGSGKTVTATGLAISGTSASNYTLASTTASAAVGIIDPKALTASLTGTVEKTYDGTTSATLAMNNYGLSGVVSGDSVSLNDPTSGTYDTANAGSGKTVTATGLALSGTSASNYTLASTTASAAVGIIDQRSVTITADNLSKLFGQPDPNFTYKVTSGSFVGADTTTGSLTRTPGEADGAYAIQQGSLSTSVNYRLIFVNGVLTITGGAPVIIPVTVLGSIAGVQPTPFGLPSGTLQAALSDSASPNSSGSAHETPTLDCPSNPERCVNIPYPTNLSVSSSIRFTPAS